MMSMMNMNGVQEPMMEPQYGMVPQQTTAVAVSVKNMTCNYRLTVDDLTTVFSRYGKLANVQVGAVDSSQATIEFCDYEAAVQCVKSLNGKVLSGEKGTLVVSLLEDQQTQHSSPYQTPLQTPMHNNMMPMQQMQQPMDQYNAFNPPHMQSPPQMPYSEPNFMQQPPAMSMNNGGFMQPMNNGFPQQPRFDPMMNQQQFHQPMDYNMPQGMPMNNQFDQQQQFHQPQVHDERPRQHHRQHRPRGDNSPSRVRKFTCRFDVGIQNEKTFQVARRIIGSKGANMKKIFKETGAKLRLRGQGSGFLEGTSQQESPEALHLCISAKKIDEYQYAVRKVEELLQGVYREYRAHCKQKDLPAPNLRVVCREHPLVTMHRNQMKSKGEPIPAMGAIGEEQTVIVADASQPIDASCNNTPQGSPGQSPPLSRQNSSESLTTMIEHAKTTGSAKEVELLQQLLTLRSSPSASAAPSVNNGENNEAAPEEAAPAPAPAAADAAPAQQEL